MAADDFRKILGIMGGKEEKARGEKLLQSLTIVEDAPSERAKTLKESASVKTRAKVIFGTADSLKVTAMCNWDWLKSEMSIASEDFEQSSGPIEGSDVLWGSWRRFICSFIPVRLCVNYSDAYKFILMLIVNFRRWFVRRTVGSSALPEVKGSISPFTFTRAALSLRKNNKLLLNWADLHDKSLPVFEEKLETTSNSQSGWITNSKMHV